MGNLPGIDGEKERVIDPRLTAAYRKLFEILSDQSKYRIYSVGEFYCDQHGRPDPDKVSVVIRIDVDSGFQLSVPLAEAMKVYGLHATQFFLTHPDRYYKLWDSGISKKVAVLGFEVGLHTEHYYEQLTLGIDGLTTLRADIDKLNQEAGTKIRSLA
jgi:hypothetical protein